MKPGRDADATVQQGRKIPLHRVIYQTLESSIRQGEFRSGDRLPSEAELCTRFGASRITVAKALQGLQQDGLVRRRPGSGSYVQLPEQASSYRFGLLIPELGNTEIFEPICQGIMRAPQARSHSLIWGHSAASEENHEAAALSLCRQFIEQRVSGVFFAPLEYTGSRDAVNQRVVQELQQASIPVVLLDRCYLRYPERSGLDRVGIDNHRAAFLLTQHLWQQGARRIVFVARKRSASTVLERISGYLFALHDAGSEFAGAAAFGDAESPMWVQQLLATQKPDAFVCGNDLTAARLMRTLIDLGVRVPQDVRLVGFDDVNYAQFLPVPLTTIHQNCAQIGQSAIEIMLKRLAEPQGAGTDTLVPFELVVRDSCGAGLQAARQQAQLAG